MKRWTIQKQNREQITQLSRELNISPLIASLLITRGYSEAESARKFLNPSYEDLHEPNLLKDLPKAVKRILRAVENGEKILVWGDYDVDGTTGTVVLRKALEIIGANSGFYIPNRFNEGYGLNVPTLEKAKQRGYTLLITVDCGSTAFEPIKWANQNGLDVIVTDHHLTKDEGLPDAYAIINPNQPDCKYPDKNLAGVGVAFKLAHALLREKGKEHIVEGFLKVVAIGTIADIMDLTGENRAIVKIGLEDLPKARNYGLKALMEICDCSSEMTSNDIGFRIAPRINAAGRMDAGRKVVELFESDSFEKAREIAKTLDDHNRERQKKQIEITQFALQQYLENGESVAQTHFAVVAGEGWHRGVIGLAASKITEKLYRPSIVISLEDGIGHGSARSISGFHLLESLDACKNLFEDYGGHAAAAGMKIKAENIEELRKKLNDHAIEKLSDEDLIPEIKIDAQISTETLDLSVAEELKILEPFGVGNPYPIFVTKNLLLRDLPFVMKEKHLKLKLFDDNLKSFEAVWWDGVEKSKGQTFKPNCRIELAYRPKPNTWQGNTRLQLNIEDLRVVEETQD